MARVVGIRVSHLFTIVFSLGAGLAGFAGVIGGPILSVYPGLDQDMLPLALVVVILGGTRQPAGLAGRQLRRRLPLQFRPGDVPRTGLRRAVPADADRAGGAAAGAVRPGRAMKRLALAVALVAAGDAAVLDRQQLLRQHRHADADLRDLGTRAERAGGIRRPGHARPCRAVRHRRLCRRGPDQRRPRPHRRCSRRAAGHARGDGDVRGAGAARHRAWASS